MPTSERPEVGSQTKKNLRVAFAYFIEIEPINALTKYVSLRNLIGKEKGSVLTFWKTRELSSRVKGRELATANGAAGMRAT